MVQFGCQQTLDGHTIALLLLVTFVCLAPSDGETHARRVLLLFLVRALESIDRAPPHGAALEARLRAVLHAYPSTCEKLLTYLRMSFASLESMDGLTDLMHTKLPDCLDGLHDEGETMCSMLLDRRSYLGLFVRRARLSYEMLLDHERTELVALCRAWRDGESALIDEWQVQAPARAFQQWRESERRGDYTATKNDLHAFFDYTLPGCDQELHQHALLNLARFHMHTEGYEAARIALDEAILLARTVGDAECMRACDRLLDQLSVLDPVAQDDRGGVLTQPETHDTLKSGAYAPLTLWKAEQERQRGRPLMGIVQTLYDTVWAPRAPVGHMEPAWEPRPSIERCAACPSSVLARVWLQLGEPRLAEAYMAHVERLGSGAPPADYDALALDACATGAYRDAERGAYAAALAALVAPAQLKRITSQALCATWQEAVWRVLWLRARRQGHVATLRRLETLCPGVGEWHATRTPGPSAAEWLAEAQAMRDAQQPHQSLEPLMKAIAASELQQLYPLYRTGLVQLAEVQALALAMGTEAQAVLAQVRPQALADENGERRAMFHMAEAKQELASRDVMRARRSLASASADWARTEVWSAQATSVYLERALAKQACDDAAYARLCDEYESVAARVRDAETAPCDPLVAQVERLVRRVSERGVHV
ncbi:hypothetical protein MCAP1_000173 [Malassezia caprae]|uniref:Anaphase-promoting complex subunit 5 n=1 Tax=Malassezia caprae TaxID=1381934 RepID=A0AAF0IUR6_9BASI|nr:hypothetical protein MCAP1_000173 [Malassezia caprae]